MSVRKVYEVLVNGVSVYSGSYASAKSVYAAFVEYIEAFNIAGSLTVVLAFQP